MRKLTPDGPAYPEVAIVMPRRGGKTTGLAEARAGRADAIADRDDGTAVSADVARRNASARLAAGRPIPAGYWAAYAAEVESWETDE